MIGALARSPVFGAITRSGRRGETRAAPEAQASRVVSTGMRPSLTCSPERYSVLLIDDEPALRNVTKRILSARFEVTAVATAEEALAHIHAGAVFDAIFCDLCLEGISGADLFACLAESYPAQADRFVMLSGLPRDACDPRLAEALGGRWLQKPVERTALLRAVTDVAEVRHAA